MALKSKIDPLSKDEINTIHDASIELLETCGITFKSEEAVAVFRDRGARVDGQRVYIPQKMAENAMMRCPSKFWFRARNPEYDLRIGQGFAVQPNTGPTDIQCQDHGRRPAALLDYINLQKMYQASDVANIVGGLPVVPQDIDLQDMHLRLMYETVKNTDKPVISYCGDGQQAEQVLEMVDIAFGRTNILQSSHVVGVSVNPLSPMAYGPEAIETMMTYARHNQPVFILPCILAGISGPVNLVGTVVQQNAEIIAGTTLIQLVNPENPVVYSPSSTVGDLNKGQYITGSPEPFLINSANLQLANDLYKVPTRIMCGMTDSDEIDCQAGYETEQNLMMGMLTGANILSNCLGTLDALMVTSYEKFMIDEELFKRFHRITDGLEVTQEALSLDIIKDVTSGSSSFLTHESTFRYCRNYWRPSVSSRGRHKNVLKGIGSEDLVGIANKKYKQLLQACPESMIDPALDAELQSFMQKSLD